MAFVALPYFGTLLWGEREGPDQGDLTAPLLEIRPGELDAVQTALRRIFYQWSDRETWITLVTLMGDLWAEQELALGSVDQARYLSTAEGLVLDEIGALVNRPREGLVDDAQYRLAIQAEAGSLFSSGTIPEIVELISAMMGPLARVVEMFPANINIMAPDQDPVVFLVLLDILADVPAAGVGALLSSWDSARVTGWSSTTDPTDLEVTDPGTWSSTTGTDADSGVGLWGTGQPIGGDP